LAAGPVRILVVDDDPLIRRQLEGLYVTHAYAVESAANVQEALEKLSASDFTLAMVDMKMPGSDGITLISEIRERWPSVDVIMITGYGTIKGAVEAMRCGACDYITKPFEPDDILLATQKVLERRRLLDEIEYLRKQLSDRYTFANMVSRDPVMMEVFSTIETLAHSDVTVVISGESGTGKELVARAIHFQGKRKAGRFVAINCAAVPESLLESELFGYERGAFTGAMQDHVGKIELSNGGTLFLDEVESIPLTMQAKLLRVLEERAIERLGSNRRVSVDMRVVVATNRDLSEAVAAGHMREDFYYRINVVPVKLPPLRQRAADVPLLVADFLRSNATWHVKRVSTAFRSDPWRCLWGTAGPATYVSCST
jgi:DNA-binding NtrC family response regulator